MKQSVHNKKQFGMKLFSKIAFAFSLLLICSSSFSFAQSGSGQLIPELVFKNPVLVAGKDRKDGAIYKFSNVAPGIDATIKITRRSSPSVKISEIDESGTGWTKAFQPTLGIEGNAYSNENWWMEFEMRFLDSYTGNSKEIEGFDVTALDVDGDGGHVREYVQMNKVATVANAPFTLLSLDLCLSLPPLFSDDTCSYNLLGTDKKVLGPAQNFANIDTGATAVMSSFHYDHKDVIKFILGARCSGGSSNAGMRMNSLWFKSFSLSAPVVILPVKLTGFNALYDNRNVSLSWSTTSEENFSHYVIERSVDGKSYKDVALVFGAGNTSLKTDYGYKDKDVSSSTGVLYYRLRLVENTGTFSYSQLRIVRLGKDNDVLKLISYPNPVTNQLKITLPANWQNKNVVIELYTSNGIRVKAVRLNNASQTETLEMTSLTRGFYLVKASCGNEVAQQEVVKH